MSWPFDRVFLARHGETEWNRAGRRQGQLDSALTVSGLHDARTIAGLLIDTDIDAIFCSPLGRAHRTAEIVGKRVGRSIEVIDDLAEVHHGEMAGLTDDEIEARFPGALRQRAGNKYEWPFPSGESYSDADARAAVALNRVAATAGSGTPLVIAHEMIGRILLRNLLSFTVAEALSLSLPHGAVIEARPGANLMMIHEANGDPS